MKRVAIAGGGVTGLTCAWMLARKGHSVTVYERAARAGGLGATFRRNGFAFDHGPHEFCTADPELVHLLEELLGDDLLVCQSRAAQYFLDAFIKYPLSPPDFIRRIGVPLLLRIGAEVVAYRLKTLVYSYSDYSFRRWVESRFGPTLYRIYFGPYTKKVWGVDPDLLDPGTASSRISFNSIIDWALKTARYVLLRKDDFSSIHSPLKRSFYYSRGGIGTLLDALEESCSKAGVEFRFGHTLTRIDVEAGRARRLHFDGEVEVGDFDYLVSTIPLTHLTRALGHSSELFPLKFRAMVFVFLEVPRRPVTPYSWVYYPDTDICFQRMTEFTHFEPTMAPDGSSGLCFELSCFQGDSTWCAPDETIVERVRSDLEAVGVLDRGVPCAAHVVRTPFAYPVQIAGHEAMVAELLQPVGELENTVSTGRQGLYKYCNMNECMEMAIDVASQIDTGTTAFRYPVRSRWAGAGREQERTLDTTGAAAPAAPPPTRGRRVAASARDPRGRLSSGRRSRRDS